MVKRQESYLDQVSHVFAQICDDTIHIRAGFQKSMRRTVRKLSNDIEGIVL